jgi:anhydro-N-acetylmuramic acid kinase
MPKSIENRTIYTAIGCMSGTSLDGMDIAVIETDGYDHIKPLAFYSYDYNDDMRSQLQNCMNKTRNDEGVKEAELIFTRAHIDKINHIKKGFQNIDFIGFHGQTIHHDPDRGITVQIGDGDVLADETGIDVIYDFRSQDMANGGQGAPLLPIYHSALCRQDKLELPIAILNLGGVGNITYIDNNDMIAFDTGPGNAMIDDWVRSKTGQKFDKGGKIASKGGINEALLTEFLNYPYFKKPYPKSLDRNDFNAITSSFGLTKVTEKVAQDPMVKLKDDNLIPNTAATLTEMTAQSVARGIDLCPAKPTAIYVTGGGRHNTYMMRRIAEITNLPIHSVDELGWNGDAMEAEGFAYMAVRSYLNEPISFPNTTGCQSPTIGGILTRAKQVAA